MTSRCNSRCGTCFYWDELNREGDLGWDEIVRLSEGAPPFRDLWFSGGEPKLRPELTVIVDLFCRKNGVQYVNLPTNGLKSSRIVEIADHCLARNRDLELHVNLALDGFEATHDRLRGVPGNFGKALDSARGLRQLKPQFDARLKVNVNTVVNWSNIDEVVPLAEFIRTGLPVDGHYFNLIRGDPKDPALKAVLRDKLRSIYPKITRIHWQYAGGLIDDRNPISRWVKKAVYVGTLAFHHRT